MVTDGVGDYNDFTTGVEVRPVHALVVASHGRKAFSFLGFHIHLLFLLMFDS